MNPHETLGERPPRRDMFIYLYIYIHIHHLCITWILCIYTYINIYIHTYIIYVYIHIIYICIYIICIYTAYVAEWAVCAWQGSFGGRCSGPMQGIGATFSQSPWSAAATCSRQMAARNGGGNQGFLKRRQPPSKIRASYPLVMTNIAIENGHRNSGFSH